MAFSLWGKAEEPLPRLDGRVIIVTGATASMGLLGERRLASVFSLHGFPSGRCVTASGGTHLPRLVCRYHSVCMRQTRSLVCIHNLVCTLKEQAGAFLKAFCLETNKSIIFGPQFFTGCFEFGYSRQAPLSAWHPPGMLKRNRPKPFCST